SARRSRPSSRAATPDARSFWASISRTARPPTRARSSSRRPWTSSARRASQKPADRSRTRVGRSTRRLPPALRQVSPIGDSSEAWQPEESTSAGLSKSVRAEIAAYFGGPPPKRLPDDDNRGG